jgi:hypothetical protein
LYSANKNYYLVLQKDCNVKLYYVPTNKVLWTTNTVMAPYGCMDEGSGFGLLANGNVGLYSAAEGHFLWSTDTGGKCPYSQLVLDGALQLIVQDDGNCVLYCGGMGPVWATQTSNVTRPTYVYQGDSEIAALPSRSLTRECLSVARSCSLHLCLSDHFLLFLSRVLSFSLCLSVPRSLFL